MNTKMILTINAISELQDFVNLASAGPGQVWVSQGKTVIRASSLMGMFSIDPTSPFCVEFDSGNIIDDFIDFCNKHMIKEKG